MPMTTESGTRSPASMYRFASRPMAVWFLTAARRMSPVEMWGMPYSLDDAAGLGALARPGRAQEDEIVLRHAFPLRWVPCGSRAVSARPSYFRKPS